MEVRFTPEEEAHLARIATQEGVDPAKLVKDAALRLLEDDALFRAGVRKGIEQADRGEFIEEEEEMDARVKQMFRPLCDTAVPSNLPGSPARAYTNSSSLLLIGVGTFTSDPFDNSNNSPFLYNDIFAVCN